MDYKLVWTPEAEDDFKTIILYLKENWSMQSANKFISRTYRRLERLAAMPSVAHATSNSSIYMYKLDHRNVVFFSLEEITLYS